MFLNYNFFFWVYAQESGVDGSYENSIFSFMRSFHIVFLVAAQFAFPPTV